MTQRSETQTPRTTQTSIRATQSAKGTTTMRQFIITLGSIAAAGAIACTASAAEAPAAYAPNPQGEIDSFAAPRGHNFGKPERPAALSGPYVQDELEALGSVRGYDFDLGKPQVAPAVAVGLAETSSGVETDEALAAALLEGRGEASAVEAAVEGFAWPSDEEALSAERGPGLVVETRPAFRTVRSIADTTSEADSMSAPRGHDLSEVERTMPARFDQSDPGEGAPRGADPG